MSQTWDVDLISPTGTSPSADIQRIVDGFNTLRSTWSGATEPAAGDRVAYMYWADTTTGTLKIRDAANAAWIIVGTLGSKQYGNLCNSSVAKSANYTVVPADRGVLLLCTGTFTLTYTAAATLGDGFTSVVRNEGTGLITLDANSAELIDEQLTITLQAGETAIVYSTGSALKTFNRVPVGSQQGNPIINGSMEVWQRILGTTLTAAANGAYSADRWRWGFAGTGVVDIRRSTVVPSVANAGVLFNYSLEVDVTTADAAIAAGDFYVQSTRIEGYNWRHFAQRQFTIGFWISSTKTGVHCVSFRNNAAATPDRCYVAEITVNVADTPEYKTITVPASPSAGTWDYTNSAGLEIAFALAVGSTFHTTAGAWQTGNFYGTVNQVNVLDNIANFFRITGVTMELGRVATPIQFVPFETDLPRCKRYYQKSFDYATAPAQASGTFNGALTLTAPVTGTALTGVMLYFSPSLCIVPSITTYNPSSANTSWRNQTDGVDDSGTSFNGLSENSVMIAVIPNATNTASDIHAIHWAVVAEL